RREGMAYLEADTRSGAARPKHTDARQTQLFNEMKARIKETDLSVPQRQGQYYYYSRTVAGQQYPILCRKRGSLTAPEEVMLDENAPGAGAGRADVRGGGSGVSPGEGVRHPLGSATSTDSVVFHEADVLYNVDLGKTKDHRFLLISDQSFDQSEIRYLSADRPTEAWRTLVPRTPGVLYPVAEHRGDDFLVLSNEHALNFTLLPLSHRDL